MSGAQAARVLWQSNNHCVLDLLAALRILKAVLNILACETAWAKKGTGEIVSMRESEEREVTFVICEASSTLVLVIPFSLSIYFRDVIKHLGKNQEIRQ